jgi:hypothetical protein
VHSAAEFGAVSGDGYSGENAVHKADIDAAIISTGVSMLSTKA